MVYDNPNPNSKLGTLNWTEPEPELVVRSNGSEFEPGSELNPSHTRCIYRFEFQEEVHIGSPPPKRESYWILDFLTIEESNRQSLLVQCLRDFATDELVVWRLLIDLNGL